MVSGFAMAASPQQFCLRWNNHQSNIISVFEQLLHTEAFVDVTLAVEGMTIKAHKVVLSACSPYFQAVLASHPDKHPIIILKDVRYVDMRDLLDFMYRGEVSVDQNNLSGFLRVAESLRIKGLTEVNERKRLESASSSPFLPSQGAHQGSPTHGVISTTSVITNNDNGSLKRPPLSPTGSFTSSKRRRGRPPKISGEESESDSSNVVSNATAAEKCEKNDANRLGEECNSVKVEAEEYIREDLQGDKEENEGSTNETSGNSSWDVQNKDDLRIPKDEPDQNREFRESPGSVLCCVPDIWTTEGRTVRLTSSAKESKRHLSWHCNSAKSPLSSNPSTPVYHIKQERLTPNATPTPTITAPSSPSSQGLLSQVDYSPIQHVPLDLHVTDSCDGSMSDVDSPNITLDYVLNCNGTATCKLCGELLPSRNHWYRHKYKTHANSLYRCEDCGVVYKSKKGFETHMEVKHDKLRITSPERPKKKEWDTTNRAMEVAKREQEEAMVKAIIARVKLECAMEGEDCTRKGYQKH